MTDLVDWIVKQYRKLTPGARRLVVYIVSAAVAICTMSFLVNPATAMSRHGGEGDSETVTGEETETSDFNSASEGEEVVVVDAGSDEVSPDTEETIVPEG